MVEEQKNDSSSAKASADAKALSDKSEDKEKEVEVPEKFKTLVEQIEKLSVLDLAELVKVLEKKFGVSASAPAVAAAAPVAGGEAGGEAEEQSEFSVVLTAPGDKKIEVIKVVRDVTGKGLKEAKDTADASASEPQVLKEGAKKEEAEEIKKKIETAGGKVELR